MSAVTQYIKRFFVSKRFYLAAACCIVFFLFAFFFPGLFSIAKIFTFILCSLTLIDYVLVFFTAKHFKAQRITAEKWSNGEANDVAISIINPFRFEVKAEVIDEIPYQVQERNFSQHINLPARSRSTIKYRILPTERGGYVFGNINIYVASLIGLVVRRFVILAEAEVPVYPAFSHISQQHLQSEKTTSPGGGNRQLRKIGQSMEFEQIKEYVAGDDIRTINWKATARKGGLMTNHYIDEKSQQVYCLLDKGRLMKMPFAGLSLLDYAINSILALQYTCLKKQDKVGLLSFSSTLDTVIAAERKAGQSQLIMQALHKQETLFKEADFEMLYTQIRHRIKQRSLLLLFTNFETLNGLKRQLAYLKSISKFHLLVVIFFDNTELGAITNASVNNVQDVYLKTIAEKYHFEKKLIVKELRTHGILSILSTPQDLTANSINKYLEIKARQVV